MQMAGGIISRSHKDTGLFLCLKFVVCKEHPAKKLSGVYSHRWREKCYDFNLGITLLSCPYYQTDEAGRPASCIRT